MKKIFYLIISLLLFITVACDETLENEEVNFSETNFELQGNWTVNAYIDNNMIFGPFTISTQMTSENESIYIKDSGEFWKFQTKAHLANSNSFETKSSLNEICNVEANVRILNGRVINKDSITFHIQFEDDETPYGITYTLKGRRK